MCVYVRTGFPAGQHGYAGLRYDAEQRDATHELTRAQFHCEVRRLKPACRYILHVLGLVVV